MLNSTKIITADPYPIVSLGIKETFKSLEWVEIVGDFTDSTSLIEGIRNLQANILIIDLSIQGDQYGNGIALLNYIRQNFSDISIIVMTTNHNPVLLHSLLTLNVNSIIFKQDDLAHLIDAVRCVRLGKPYISTTLSHLLQQSVTHHDKPASLSPREKEVLRLFAEGLVPTEIAKRLGRSIKTISGQKKSAMRKLDVENDIELLDRLTSFKYNNLGQLM